MRNQRKNPAQFSCTRHIASTHRCPWLEPLENRLLFSTGAFEVQSAVAAGKGSVAGVVFNDLNGNRVHDPNETGAKGWLVWADLNKDGRLNYNEPRTVTNSAGKYTLTNVPAGYQLVRLEHRSGSQQTIPRGGGAHGPTLIAGRTTSGWNFGVRPSIVAPTIINGAAVSISSTGAVLQASVNANGRATTIRFQYSTDPAFKPEIASVLSTTTSLPTGVAMDAFGNVFVSNYGDNDVKKIQATGASKVLRTGFTLAQGIAVDTGGNVFVIDHTDNDVKVILPGGKVKRIASGVSETRGLTIDAANNLYVSDYYGNVINQIRPDGTIRKLGGGFAGPWGMAVDKAGNVFVADEGNGAVKKILPDGRVQTVAAGFNMPTGVAVDLAGNIFVADTHHDAIKQILPTGVVRTLATGFGGPQALAVDAIGNVFVADTWYNRIVKLSPPGVPATPAELNGTLNSQVTGKLTGLLPRTTYYYRVVTTGPGGMYASAVRSFRTSS